MRIAIAQIISGVDTAANLGVIRDYAGQAKDAGAQLVVFPEATMRAFGHSLKDIAEPLDGPWAGEVRRIAKDVRKVVQSAIANAENNHQLDVDKLYIAEASVGRAFALKRFHARARGRGARVQKMWSHLTIVVREREETA